ncbi:MAG: diacylglycerol kinase family lipid kinase [Lachnospiraceae bacterium]|nr:diacylglycerol kinase family lipid kinase [Lachnospiraceae bacterium]
MIYFIINPHAKSGYIEAVWDEIQRELAAHSRKYCCYKTKRPKDATRIARKLTSGKKGRKIVILGGDGTLNEFLNGMCRTEGIQLGYLPLGSGNDFARGMEISRDYKKELKKMLEGTSCRELDYGIVDYPDGRRKRFFVSSGMGYDAKVCYEANHTKMKRILNQLKLGKLVYLIIGVRDLIQAETFCGSLMVDGKEVLVGSGFLFVSFHNMPYEGGGFQFCPDADSSDGQLDLCVAKGMKKWKIPFIIPLAAFGKHIHCKGVYQFRCKEAVMRSGSGQFVHTDGETKKKERRIRIRISDKKIRFMN